MARCVLEDADNDYRYRIVETDRGYLLSCSQKGSLGLLIGPAEWLYRREEAARAGYEFVRLFHAYWIAMMHGLPNGTLPARCEKAAAQHKATVERLGDEPLIGAEVKELCWKLEANAPAVTPSVTPDQY